MDKKLGEIMASLKIILHRGGTDYHTENSMNAIKSCYNMGVIPEIDIRLSKDGIPFILHDETLKRTTKAAKEIRDTPVKTLNYSTIKQASFQSNNDTKSSPPPLEDVLKMISTHKTCEVVLDVKDLDAYEICFEMIRSYGVANQITFTSASIKELVRCKQALPSISTSLWLTDLSSDLYKEAVNTKEIDTIVYIHWSKDQSPPPFASIEEIQSALQRKPLVIYKQTWGKDELKRLYEAKVRLFMLDRSMDFFNAFKT